MTLPFRAVRALLFSTSLLAMASVGHAFPRPTPQSERAGELVIIDAGVADAAELAAAVRPGVEVLMLDPQRDALEQILHSLRQRRHLAAAHVISHAEPGALILGGRRVDAARFTQSEMVRAIDLVLGTNGELRLYGCQLAAGDAGAAFYDAVSRAVTAKVSASTDFTGDSALGGNWVLEAGHTVTSGSHPFREGFHYRGLLPPTRVVNDPSNQIYTRPGGSSYVWSYGSYLNTGFGIDPAAPITQVDFHNVVDIPNGFNWVLTRGSIQYATSTAGPWTTITPPTNATAFHNVAGRVWRFVDAMPADSTTANDVGVAWFVQGFPTAISSGLRVVPDLPPTDVFSSTDDFWGAPALNDEIAPLKATDTGASFNALPGLFTIDSQSVANLFATSGDTLTKGSGALPAVGQSVTVTLRYRDWFQLDENGNGLAGEGTTRTVTLTRRDNPAGFSNDVMANTFTTNSQTNPSIAGLSDGSYVVVWRSAGQNGETTSQGGIYGQKFSAAGAKVGSEFAISPPTNNINDATPSVAGLAGGRFVVAYQQANTDSDIIFRIVEANGTLGAETQAPSTATGGQTAPWVTALSDGNFAIAWIGPNGADTADIWVRKFNSSNGAAVSGSELVVNATTTGSQAFPSVAGLSNGNYAVTWRDPADSGDVYSRVMGPAAAVSGEVAVSAGTEAANSPRIAALTGGGFVVVFSVNGRTAGSIVDTSSQSNIYARRYDNSGVLQGSEFLVNAAARSNQINPGICGLSGGGFLVSWLSNTDPDDTNGTFGRRFNANGTASDSYDFQLNQRRADIQSFPIVAPLLTNSFGVAWADNTLDGNNQAVASRSFTAVVPDPEIALSGNSTAIADGDTTPSAADHTDFGSQSVASGNIVRTFTIQNTGPGPLNITSVNITGTHAADFTVTASPSSPVAASGSTTFQVTFNPNALGARTATVTVNSNDVDEAAYDFAIQGTGVDPEINLQGNAVTIADGDTTPSAADHTDFGSQSVASGTIVRTFTIQNTGTANLTISSVNITGAAAGDFSVTASPSTPVSAAGSTTFQVTFNPSTPGARNATITVNSNDGDEAAYDFAITGTGVPDSTVVHSVQTTSFGGADGVVAPGETITYELQVTVPVEGATTALQIRSDLPAGETYVPGSATVIPGSYAGTFSALNVNYNGGINRLTFSSSFTPTADGNSANNTVTITYQATVLDVVGNSGTAGSQTVLTATSSHDNGGANPSFGGTNSTATVTVVEPRLAIAGSLTVNGAGTVGDAGDPFTYTIAVSPTPSATSRANDVTFSNTLPIELGAVTLSSAIVSDGATSTNVAGAFDLTGNTLTTNAPLTLLLNTNGSNDQGLTLTLTGVLTSSVNPSKTTNLTTSLAYSSLPGLVGGERNYSGSDMRSFSAPNGSYSVSLFSTDQAFTTGTNVAIGETVTYAMLVTLPEGTTPNLSLVAVLPAGLIYVPGSASVVTTAGASGGLLAADFNGTVPVPSVAGGGSSGADVTFTFGSTTTVTGDNVTGNNRFLVRMDARVMDVAGNSNGTTLGTNITADIVGDSVGVFTSPAVDVTVAEPLLAVTQNVTETTVRVGNPVNFTLTAQNTGGAASLDTRVSLPLDPAFFNTASIQFGTAGTDYPTGYTPSFAGGSVIYQANSATSLAAGGTHTFHFTVNILGSAAPGLLTTSAATGTVTSLPGASANERSRDFTSGTDTVTITAPEIVVSGNGIVIFDGDVTPSAVDHSDFGSQSVASGNIVRTFTIQNTGTAILNISGVAITGAASGDFAVTTPPAATVAAASSTTFQVTFNPSVLGARPATVTVNNDDFDEPAYDFAITGTGVDPEINVQGNSATIADGDITPSATDHTDFGIQEVSSGTVVRTFTVQNTGTANLTFGAVNISGTNAADFSVTALPASPVAPAGSTTFQVTFDPSAAGLRTATVTVNSNDEDEAAYDLAIQGTGRITPQLSISDVTLSEGNAPGTTTFNFAVTLSSTANTGGVTFDIATADNTAQDGNPGSEDNDYVASSLAGQTIPEGGTGPFQFSVTVNRDDIVEANETFFVNVTNVSGATVLDGQGLGTITNDDTTTVTLAGGSTGNEGTPGNSLRTFTATLSNPVQGGFNIAYTTNDGTATTADNDYIDNDGTITFAGTASEVQFVQVTVRGDNKVEANETFTVALGAIAGAANAVAISTAGSPQTETITNDDSANVTVQSVSQSEAITPMVFTVTLSNPVDVPVTVQFSTTGDSATAGTDYTEVTNQLVSFAAGTTTQTVNVTVADDGDNEINEVFNVALSSLNNGGRAVSMGMPSGGTGTITNDDALSVSIVAQDDSADENAAGTGVYRVSRNSIVGSTTVNLQIDAGSSAVAADYGLSGGTVNFGSLAPGSSGTVVIPGGATFVDVTLTPVGDIHAEAAETARLNIAPDAGYTISNNSNATVTVAANDFVVINTSDSGEGTLRQAVLNANAIAGANTITFEGGVFTDTSPDVIGLSSAEIGIASDLTIQGLGADVLTIQNLTVGNRVFNVTSGNVTIGGVTITGGNTFDAGAGVNHTGGDLTLISVAISGNTSLANLGGGVFHGAGNLTIIDSTISGNAAGSTSNGGGVQVTSTGATTISNSTISGNRALRGGGLRISNGTTTISNCTITGNSATGEGGGLSQVAGTLIVRNTIVAGNSCPNGAEVRGVGGTFTSASSLFGHSGLTSAQALVGVGLNASNLLATADGTLPTALASIVSSLADHGGPTQTHTLVAGSPALNAGDNALAPSDPRLQGVTVGGSPGTFTLTYNGATTAALASSVSAGQMQVSLNNLPTIGGVGGSVSVSGGAGVYLVEFSGTLVRNSILMTGTPSGGATVTVSGLVTYDQRGPGFARIIGPSIDIGAVEALAYTPTVASPSTSEDTMTAPGALTISANPADNGETTHYKITNVLNGTLFQADGTTPVLANTFVTLAEGTSGLRFMPSLNLHSTNTPAGFHFDVQATTDGADTGLKPQVATANITVNSVNDIPEVVPPGIPDQSIVVTQTLNVPLSSRFKDVDLETLTFTVSGNTATAKVHAVIATDGVSVDVTGLEPGSSDVTIRATDAATAFAEDTFRVQVTKPAPGSSIKVSQSYKAQTGLFEMQVEITNNTAVNLFGFRLRVTNLPASLKLYNATSPPGSADVYADHAYPVAIGEKVVMTILFYSPTRTWPAGYVPAFSIEGLTTPVDTKTSSTGVPITRVVEQADGSILLEFPAVIGRWYRVKFSDNSEIWKASLVPIKAASTRVQWVDKGPPFTDVHPGTVANRFYLVEVLPAP